MNEYEIENVKQIRKEIKEYEEKNGKMSKEKKAYYIYQRMGQIYSYKESYRLATNSIDKVNLHNEGTSDKGEAICTDMNRGCVEAMRQENINAKLLVVDANTNPFYHADGCFEVEGQYYFFNLTSDVMRIQTGMRTRHFGVSQERLRKRLHHEDPRKNREYLLIRMNEKNDGEKFVEIQQEVIEEWDKEFGFSYKGLYTNDILEMLKKESFDKEFMEEFFETDKPDELLQRKFEFAMKYIGIILSVNRKRNLGNIEALEYYFKLSKNMITKEEQEKYIELCSGYIEKDGRRKLQNVVLIKKENDNVYYIYDEEKQIYEKIEEEELRKTDIIYKDQPISKYIENQKERLKRQNKDNSEEICI